ncbi:MAG: hypothetical protein RXP77_02375, partial [Nitrososphaeria archaeon]
MGCPAYGRARAGQALTSAPTSPATPLATSFPIPLSSSAFSSLINSLLNSCSDLLRFPTNFPSSLTWPEMSRSPPSSSMATTITIRASVRLPIMA